AHAAEDKKKRELIEARNQADGLVYSTEKSLKEHGEKVDAATRQGIETALEALKKAMEGEDAEALRSKSEALAQAAHKLAEAMYAQAAQQAGGEEGAGQSEGDDKVVDAEFEEVKDDKK
ncbi:MAG TPA: molecular chaperone DnaK, partial [Desulfuromonas sp.]|nr:molecular chaperone DnaK [Desulfuromonas sp.]